MQNLTKWVNLSFLAAGVLAWALLREVFALVFDGLGWMRLNWLIGPADLAGIASGAALFLTLRRSAKSRLFLEEAFTELARVVWPNKKETFLSTGVVSLMVAFATVCILIFDSIWAWVAERFLY